jgi:hypothetical protein
LASLIELHSWATDDALAYLDERREDLSSGRGRLQRQACLLASRSAIELRKSAALPEKVCLPIFVPAFDVWRSLTDASGLEAMLRVIGPPDPLEMQRRACRLGVAILMTVQRTSKRGVSPRLARLLWTQLWAQDEPGGVPPLVFLDGWSDLTGSQQKDLARHLNEFGRETRARVVTDSFLTSGRTIALFVGVALATASLIAIVFWSNLLADRFRITEPAGGKTVCHVNDVTVRALDSVTAVWVVVHPDNDLLYFVQPRSRLANGFWITSAYFGDPVTPSGWGFQIGAFGDLREPLYEGKTFRTWPDARLASKRIHVKRAPC